MSKINEEWKVGPHGQIEKLDDGLLSVAGESKCRLATFLAE